MRKVYKYFITYLGMKDSTQQIGNVFMEYGEPLDTQSSIEKARADIKKSDNYSNVIIIFIKRIKVDRLERDTNGKN